MQFLEYLKIYDSWIVSGIVYALLGLGIFLFVAKYAMASRFIGEVKGELRKASWPWESDPKIKGFRKYKELVDSTVVVLIAVILLAAFVQFWDLLLVNAITFLTTIGH